MAIDGPTIVSTGIGAFIGSILTLIATFISHHLQRSRDKERDKQHIRGYLQGLHDEIETLWDSYMEGVGSQVDASQDEQPLAIYWAVTQDYFTVYNANAHLIGQIDNVDLRKSIVSTYSKARGLIDSFRMNNELVHKLEYTQLLFQETQLPVHQTQANAHLKTLTMYAKAIRKSHQTLKESVQKLLRDLRKLGVLSENS